MAAWPSYAEILLEEFGFDRAPAVERTDMESGPPKQLRTKSRVMVTVPARALFRSKSDYLAFLAWFRADINQGADWFDWMHPVSESTVQARIVGGQLGKAVPSGSLNAWEVPMNLEYWDA